MPVYLLIIIIIIYLFIYLFFFFFWNSMQWFLGCVRFIGTVRTGTKSIRILVILGSDRSTFNESDSVWNYPIVGGWWALVRLEPFVYSGLRTVPQYRSVPINTHTPIHTHAPTDFPQLASHVQLQIIIHESIARNDLKNINNHCRRWCLRQVFIVDANNKAARGRQAGGALLIILLPLRHFCSVHQS
jgi:hypothetical protein